MDEIKTNVGTIPELQLRILAQAVLDAAQRFHSDPESLRKFEVWKAQQNTIAGEKKA